MKKSFYEKQLIDERKHAGMWYMVAHILAKQLSEANGCKETPEKLIEQTRLQVERNQRSN